ncbi:MAG: DUF547 domain-containing protein [Bacteroidota bacterium]
MRTSLFLLLLVLICSCGTGKIVTKDDGPEPTPVAVTTTQDTVIVQLPDSVRVVTAKEEKIDPVITKDTVVSNPPRVEIFNHVAWNLLLQKYVTKDGVVNYEGFRLDKGLLRDYIASLGAHMPDESWSQEDKLAYWMNAYNAMTVDLIVRNLPLQSIKEIDKPWDQRLWKLGAKWYNLDEIEHKILRKMGDARIHFGINCASFSCPPLLNKAFSAQQVDAQLDQLARDFINDPRRNMISEDRVRLSKIFSWFSKDFKTNGTVIEYISKYSEKTINPNARKSFMEYDWSLNN